MHNLKITVSALFLSSFLIGCGGGDPSNPTSLNNNLTPENNPNSIGDSNPSTTNSSLRIYPYKTGRITYALNSNFDGSGITMVSVGTETLVFKDWGNVSVEEKREEITTTYVDPLTGETNTTVENKHELKKWDSPKKYDVNFEQEKILVVDFSAFLDMLSSNPEGVGEAFTPLADDISDSTTILGTKEVLGVSCVETEITNLGTSCIHENNLTLSVHTNAFGTTDKVATSIEFNIDIDDSEFALPDFTIIEP